MKKIILLLFASFVYLTVMAQKEYVQIQLQVSCNDWGSEVHYTSTSGQWHVEPLRPGNNFYEIDKGAHLEVWLLLEGGGTLNVSGHETRYTAAPTTDGFILNQRMEGEPIIIRLDPYYPWAYSVPYN